MNIRVHAGVWIIAVCFVGAIAAAESPVGWRTDGTGRYPKATPPTDWSSTENIVWKTKLPGRSYSSPLVVGNHIFVVSDPSELLCVRATDGKILWQRTTSAADVLGPKRAQEMLQQWKELNDRKKKVQRAYGELKKSSPDAKDKLEKLRDQVQEVGKQISRMKQSNPVMSNRGNGNTTATPVFDGQHVYVVFGNGIVASFTVKGERRWAKFVEGSVIGFGHASSPVLVGDKLVVHFNDMIALGTQDGDVVWRTQLRARHATSIAVRIGDIAALISPAGSVVRVRDGKVLLTERALQVSEGSPVVFENVVYVQSGKTSAFKLPTSAGDTVELELLWQQPSARGRRTPSPVYADGLLYGVTTNGILEVTDAETGDLAYRKRLDIGKNFYSSATAAGELIYLSSTQGVTIVIERGTQYAEVARNQLESFGSNPVFVGNRMYVRGYKHLYCIGE